MLTILVLLLTMTPLLIAQEDETPESTPAVTTPVEITQPEATAPQPVESASETVSISFGIIGILIGIGGFGAGAMTGGLGVLAFINRARQNVDLQDMTEKLFLSLPPDALKFMQTLAVGTRDSGELLVAVTDGQPNKPLPNNPPVTLDEADKILYGDPEKTTDK